MSKRTVKINQSNWTGKSVKIEIDDKERTVELHDVKYTLLPTGDDTFSLHSSEHGAQPVGWVAKMYDGVWVAKSDFADITREDADPFVAVAKLFCNL